MRWKRCKLEDVPIMGIFKFCGDIDHIDVCYLRIYDVNTVYARNTDKVVCIRMSNGEVTWDQPHVDVDLYMGDD